MVHNSGGGSLNWLAWRESGVWWLYLTSYEGTDGDAFAVHMFTPGLNAGTHTTYVRITDALADAVDVPVTLRLWAKPVIAPSPTELNFAAVDGGVSPDVQLLTVNNSGELHLSRGA